MAHESDRLYFRQLLAGYDFARDDPMAAQMVNFCYLIGDRETRECVVVDPAWDVDGLLRVAEDDGMQLTGALVTHYHPDHVGGDLFGHGVEGLAALMERKAIPVHCQKEEARGVQMVTGLSASDLTPHDPSDVVTVGEVPIQLLHTPGHTPGSQCFLVGGNLVAGDTLFVQGCGRVDFPGGDAEQMYLTLTQRLAALPDETVLYPGHHYGDVPHSTFAEQRRTNYCLRPRTLADWLTLMG
ncbi:MAG: MBL fold metallo-hydrolase [Thermoanaerobaculia bacterium]